MAETILQPGTSPDSNWSLLGLSDLTICLENQPFWPVITAYRAESIYEKQYEYPLHFRFGGDWSDRYLDINLDILDGSQSDLRFDRITGLGHKLLHRDTGYRVEDLYYGLSQQTLENIQKRYPFIQDNPETALIDEGYVLAVLSGFNVDQPQTYFHANLLPPYLDWLYLYAGEPGIGLGYPGLTFSPEARPMQDFLQEVVSSSDLELKTRSRAFVALCFGLDLYSSSFDKEFIWQHYLETPEFRFYLGSIASQVASEGWLPPFVGSLLGYNFIENFEFEKINPEPIPASIQTQARTIKLKLDSWGHLSPEAPSEDEVYNRIQEAKSLSQQYPIEIELDPGFDQKKLFHLVRMWFDPQPIKNKILTLQDLYRFRHALVPSLLANHPQLEPLYFGQDDLAQEMYAFPFRLHPQDYFLIVTDQYKNVTVITELVKGYLDYLQTQVSEFDTQPTQEDWEKLSKIFSETEGLLEDEEILGLTAQLFPTNIASLFDIYTKTTGFRTSPQINLTEHWETATGVKVTQFKPSIIPNYESVENTLAGLFAYFAKGYCLDQMKAAIFNQTTAFSNTEYVQKQTLKEWPPQIDPLFKFLINQLLIAYYHSDWSQFSTVVTEINRIYLMPHNKYMRYELALQRPYVEENNLPPQQGSTQKNPLLRFDRETTVLMVLVDIKKRESERLYWWDSESEVQVYDVKNNSDQTGSYKNYVSVIKTLGYANSELPYGLLALGFHDSEFGIFLVEDSIQRESQKHQKILTAAHQEKKDHPLSALYRKAYHGTIPIENELYLDIKDETYAHEMGHFEEHYKHGLKFDFFESASSQADVVGKAYPQPYMQGFPGIVHGGISSTILDEISCYAIYHQKKKVAVTLELQCQYYKPLQHDYKNTTEPGTYIAQSKIIRHTGKIYSIVSHLYREDKKVAASSTGLFYTPSIAELQRMTGVEEIPESMKTWFVDH